MADKTYSRIKDAEDMVKQLCEKQPEVLWCVRPDIVGVLGVENKERSKKNTTLAKIKPIKAEERTLFQDNNIPTRYIISLYWSDWREWSTRKKQWILFHELLHIAADVGKTISHDSEDFKIILDKVGVNWTESDTLPDLINDKVEFDLDLRPSLEQENEEGDEIPEEEIERQIAKKQKKNKKEEEDDLPEDSDEKEEPKAEGDVF
jgi:hypothetical protein